MKTEIVILAAALMLDHLALPDYARRVRRAIRDTIASGDRLTRDLGGDSDTQEYTDAVIERL